MTTRYSTWAFGMSLALLGGFLIGRLTHLSLIGPISTTIGYGTGWILWVMAAPRTRW